MLSDRFRTDLSPAAVKKDNGLHKGWYIGKGNQRKMLSGVWIPRYQALSPANKDAFVVWWNNHYRDDPKSLEKRWLDWRKSREVASGKPQYRPPASGNNSKAASKSPASAKGKAKKK